MLCLRQQSGISTLRTLAQLLALIERCEESRLWNGIGAALYLYLCGADGRTVAGDNRTANETFAPDHRYFDCIAAGSIDKQRDYAARGKYNLLYGRAAADPSSRLCFPQAA